MFKFVTIYRRVDDEAQIDDFFSRTHLPLAEQLPGVVKFELSRVTGKPGGQSRFYLMYEMYFESREAYERAFVSESGIKLMKALIPWSEAKILTWFHTDSFEE